MKTLTLIIKREYFDQIIAGTKVQEFREIKPTTASRYVEKNEEGLIIVNDNGNTIPVRYDAIRFYVGYNKDRDSALVEVKSAYTEILTQYVKWPDGTPMRFEVDEEGNVMYFQTDEDGKLVVDKNGNRIPTDDRQNGCPIPIRDGREGGLITEPIIYEYKDQEWWRERVVYNLGKVLEKDIHSKK